MKCPSPDHRGLTSRLIYGRLAAEATGTANGEGVPIPCRLCGTPILVFGEEPGRVD